MVPHQGWLEGVLGVLMLVPVVNIISLVVGFIALFYAVRNYRIMRKHYRLMDVRIIFIELWGVGKYEFIRTGKGWHAIGHRPMSTWGPETNDDTEVVVVPWSGK